MVARNIDIWEIRTWKWSTPSPKYPNGVLWVFTRRKGRKRWGYVPVIPTSVARPECAVRLFRLYLWKLHTSPSWKRAPTHDEFNQPGTVWRSSLDVTTSKYATPHHCLAESTLSSECGDLLHLCGVPSSYSAKSCRGAVSTFLLECGETQDVVMKRGDWTTMSVFQQYYSRVSNSRLFADLLSDTQRLTGKLPTSNFDEENDAIEQAKSVIANRVEDLDDIEDYALGDGSPNETAHTHWETKTYLRVCAGMRGTITKCISVFIGRLIFNCTDIRRFGPIVSRFRCLK